MPPHASSLELFRALRPLPAARSFLDVGCGSGCQSILLGGGAVRATGFDVSPRAVGFAHANAMLNGIDATYVLADCESFRTDEPFDRVAFNAPRETAFAFLNSGVDRLLTHDGEVFVWFTHEVTAIDGSLDNALRSRVGAVDRLHVEISLNADSPFALSREMVRARKLPADTLLINHPAEAGSYFDGLAKRQVVEVVSAVLSVQRREAGGGDVHRRRRHCSRQRHVRCQIVERQRRTYGESTVRPAGAARSSSTARSARRSVLPCALTGHGCTTTVRCGRM